MSWYAGAAVEDALKALAHEQRRALLALLMDGERPAGELAEAAGLRQPTASQHLKVLRDADLVIVEARGNQRLYRVNFERVAEVRAGLDAFWSAPLDRLARAAKTKARRSSKRGGGRR